MYVFACDIGGTNCRMALVQSRECPEGDGSDGRAVASGQITLEKACLATAQVRDAAQLHGVARQIFGEKLDRCRAVCLAVAGPISEQGASLTNAGLHLVRSELEALFGVPLVLANDFAAVAAALDMPAGRSAQLCQGPAPENKACKMRAVAGAGTGFGCALVLPTGESVPSEGGHMLMGLATDEEAAFAQSYVRRHHREYQALSMEDLVAGRGLEELVFYCTGERLDAAACGKKYLGGEDKDADERLASSRVGRLYATFLARACKNWALATLCEGGLWLAGSLAMRNPALLRSPHFQKEFLAGVSPRHKEFLQNVPVLLFRDDDYGLQGAACLALREAARRA